MTFRIFFVMRKVNDFQIHAIYEYLYISFLMIKLSILCESLYVDSRKGLIGNEIS